MREMLLGDFALLLFRVKGRALCLAVGWSVGVGKGLNWIGKVSVVGPCVVMKITKMPLLLSFHNSETPETCFQFP